MDIPFIEEGIFEDEVANAIRESGGILIQASLLVDSEGVVCLEVGTPLPEEKEKRLLEILAGEILKDIKEV